MFAATAHNWIDSYVHLFMCIGYVDEACSIHGGDKNCIQNFNCKLEVKRPLGRHGCR